MGKKLSVEIVDSDSDESMEDASAPTNDGDSSSIGSKTSSKSESESESDNDSSDESESEAETNSPNSRPSLSKKREYVFVPPTGFKQSQPKTQPSPAISSALSNLEDKQVFHITAPSSLPISQIQEIAFGKALLEEPILSHQGIDYGLVADTEQNQGSETLLVYDKGTNTFSRKQELRNIERYNIREMVRLPNLASLVPPTQEATTKNPAARPHPKHLRMRFHPVGSQTLPAETIGSSSESEAEEPTFRVPSKSLNKRGSDDHGESEKKSKKFKTDKPSSQEPSTRRDKEKKSSKHRDETSQERRARKEEKKKRKAEKGK